MDNNIIEETIEFSQELYEKNLKENDFSNKETDGIGDDNNANN